MMRPRNDFSSPQLASLFSAKNTSATPTPSPSPTPSSLSGGAIAGIVVGSVAVLAIIGGGIFYRYWRKKHKSSSSQEIAEIGAADIQEKDSVPKATSDSKQSGYPAELLSEYVRPSELGGGSVLVAELPASDGTGELPASPGSSELPGSLAGREVEGQVSPLGSLDEGASSPYFGEGQTTKGEKGGKGI